MAALLIGPDQIAALHDLRDRAAAAPVNMRGLGERLSTAEGKAAHVAQMTAQSIELPVGVLVCFSIETGHPCGTARHMSMSVKGKLPPIPVAWMIAAELGFGGAEDFSACTVWRENLAGHGEAINAVQPLDVQSSEGNA
jgi:hypothetical protein